MRDIACAQYVAGGNCKFFATGQLSGGTASLGDCKNNMMKRLAFADDVGAPYDSMLAFPAHAGQFTNGALDTVMSITSRLLPWEVQSTSAPNAHNSFPGGEAVYKQYAINLQLHTIHFGEDMKSAENMEFISQGSTNACPHGSNPPNPPNPPPAHSALAADARAPVARAERTVLHGPAPAVRPVRQGLLLAGAGPGPLRPRRDPRRCEVASRYAPLRTATATAPALAPPLTASSRTQASP